MEELLTEKNYWGHWGRSWDDISVDGGILGEVVISDTGKVHLHLPDGMYVRSMVGVKAESTDYLFGILNDGRCIVLQDCHSTLPCYLPGVSEGQNIFANALLASDEAFDPNAQIEEISFRLQHLERWAHPTDENNTGIFSGFVLGDRPAPCVTRQWYSSEGLAVWLASGPDISFDLPSSIDMRRDCKLTIKFTNAVSLDEAIDTSYLLLLLVSFCAGWYAGFTEVIAANSEGAAISVIRQFHKGADVISVQHKQPVPYNVFEPRCSDLIGQWLFSEGDFRTAIREYVPIALLGRSSFLELEFFAASQILETLGRAVDAVNSGAKKENAELLAKLRIEAQALEEGDLKSWILQEIDRQSHPPLIQLLKNLYSFIGPYSKEIFKDKQSFAYHQKENRNIFAHGKHSASALQNRNLFFQTQGIFMLCQAAIMRLLDFSERDVSELLGRCHSHYVKHKLNC